MLTSVVASVVEWAQSRPFLAFSVAVPTALYLFDEVYVHSRRVAATRVDTLPERFSALMTQSDFVKARNYRLDRLNFAFWHNAFSFTTSMAKLVLGWLPFVWGVSANVLEWAGFEASASPGLHAFLFFQIMTFADQIMHLPWTIYHTFVLEQKHGFNKQTAGFFIKDQLKGTVLTSVLMFMFVPAFVRIIVWAGDAFYFYAWLFSMLFSLFTISVYPDFIAPLFDKYTDLPTGPLRTAIEALASSLDFPLTKLLVVEGSKRSAHSNAYFFGFFKNKRIVLFDTLMGPDSGVPKDAVPAAAATNSSSDSKGCTVPQITAVVAHELGHWYHNHVLKGFVLQQGILLGMLWGSGLLLHNQWTLVVQLSFDLTQPCVCLQQDYSALQQRMNMVVAASKYARATTAEELMATNELKRGYVRDASEMMDDDDDEDEEEAAANLPQKQGRKLQ
ncbi:Afc1 protein [Salpingoeca rosetta]|uniref:CAAX prenyl protease n=1 Tax=Salpingoeca rosetta (strain ATCC 50818 / BSB-021) TaxID=946362 RepID=F2UNA8_SALR5|nr:Afc1 protein [Salpingoeca rosetta]EGD79113.1 Afc1 protein [Salpingoeca rosetta]|eukprot:XP_004989198.1 Afc1 protein [Salpingoeca rosetta]